MTCDLPTPTTISYPLRVWAPTATACADALGGAATPMAMASANNAAAMTLRLGAEILHCELFIAPFPPLRWSDERTREKLYGIL